MRVVRVRSEGDNSAGCLDWEAPKDEAEDWPSWHVMTRLFSCFESPIFYQDSHAGRSDRPC